MECERVREEFIERLTGTFDPSQSAGIDQHLATCAACRAETDRMREMWTELGALHPPVGTGGAERMQRLIEARGRATPVSQRRGSRVVIGTVGTIAMAASLMLGVVLGQRFANGRATAPLGDVAAVPKERYVLLLHGRARTGPGGEQAIVAEYRTWAMKLRDSGSLVLAEKLADDPVTMLAANSATELPHDTPDEVGGLFLIQVADSAEAFRIARECPHLRHGGTVQVRRIQPT